MALDEAWDVLKSGNMPPPSPPYDPNDPDSPQNDDTVMDNSRNYWLDSSKCPACENPTQKVNQGDVEGACQTLGCPLSPIRELPPEVSRSLSNYPVQSGRKDLLPTENAPATAGPDYDRAKRRQEEFKRYFREKFRRD